MDAEEQERNSESNTSAIAEALERDVRPWLNLMEDLRSLSLDKELSIPQIAVMGDQSSGKSSVLEALSNIPFPRGSGLTTRCPIRLVMRTASSGQQWSAKVSTTKASIPQQAVTSLTELTSLIERFTSLLTNGNPSEFSSETIIVDITAPDAPNLTLIDLPGIVRTATAGQSSAVISQINSLIESYLKQERTIILAVIPANQDIATVDILERAQQVDPSGNRTVGVLTKADLIGPGNEGEVVAVLNNQRKPLKLGYVMVKNRSQADIASGVSPEMARNAEQEFFSNHPDFSLLDPKLFSVKNLTSRLTQVLVARIQQEIVPMRNEIEAQLGYVRAELKALNSYNIGDDISDRQKLMVTIIQEYVRHLTECVQGEYRDRHIVMHPELRLYTRVLTVFEAFKNRVNGMVPNFQREDFIAELARQMEDLRGRELPGFMSPQSFYMFMSQYVEEWRGPACRAASEIKGLCVEVTTRLIEVIAVQYPVFRNSIRKIAFEILDESLEQVHNLIEEMLSREKDPFTINDFLSQHVNKIRYDRFEAAVIQAFQKASFTGANIDGIKAQAENELKQWYRKTHGVNSTSNAEDMSAILEAYWTLSSRRFVDNICMGIDRKMLSCLASRIQEDSYAFVHEDEKLKHLFEEDSQLVFRRRQLMMKQEQLTKANSALANLQIRRATPAQVQVTIEPGQGGLGFSLADDGGKVLVKSFRVMPVGVRNPAQEAGLCAGDVIEAINGDKVESFDDAIVKLQKTGQPITLSLAR